MKATDVMYFFKTIFLFIAQLLATLMFILTVYTWAVCDVLTTALDKGTRHLEKLNDFIHDIRVKKQPKGE